MLFRSETHARHADIDSCDFVQFKFEAKRNVDDLASAASLPSVVFDGPLLFLPFFAP